MITRGLFGNGVTESACLAHIRRKLFELHAANKSAMADEALRRIGELYQIERRSEGLAADAREALQRAEALPKLAALHSWLLDTRERLPKAAARQRPSTPP